MDIYFCENIIGHYFILYTRLRYYCFTKLKAFLFGLLEVIKHPPTVGTFCKSWAFPKIQIQLVICGRWRGVCAQGVGTRSNGGHPVLWTRLHTHSHIQNA